MTLHEKRSWYNPRPMASSLKNEEEVHMSVRAKLTLTAITETNWNAKILKFSTVYDSNIPEDQRFQKATPSGSAEMQVDNPAALEHFHLGKSYYVDFSEAP